MSLWTLLRHRLRSYWRVPFFERRALSLILGGFLVLYLAGGLALLGIVFDDLVRETAPGREPLLVASRWLLPLGLLYAALRVFVESGLGTDPKPYRVLPIRRSVLVVLLAIVALLSLWNAVPMAFVATVCIEAALDGALGPALRFGIVSMGVLAAVTCVVPMVRRLVSDRPLLAAGGVGLIAGSAGLEAVPAAEGAASLFDVSEWGLGGFVQAELLPTAAFAVLLGGLVVGYGRWLRGAMGVDPSSRKRSVSEGTGKFLEHIARRGPAWREAVFEMRLLLRNLLPRITIFNVLLVVGAIAFIGVLPIEASDLRESALQLYFAGHFGTGGLIVWHGQNLFSYEGRCLEASLARPVSAAHRVAGKLLFLGVGVLVCFLLPLPVLLSTQSPFLVVHAAIFLYNLGLLAPATLAGATFNRKALAIDKLSFRQTNVSGVRMAIMVPLIGLPLVPMWLFDSIALQFGTIAGLGGLSMLAWPLWRRGLTALYRRNRYAMMRGFRASRE